MFKKILIANRGEIAVRIIQTCKKINIKTVAIFSEADDEAPHVEMADEAFLVGKPRVNESYLKVDKIIDVAKEAGADAVHPGYGLLSENADFANRCQEADITFIGPSAEVISRMGDKIEARKTMEKAGVPLVPGVNYKLADADDRSEERRVGRECGYS